MPIRSGAVSRDTSTNEPGLLRIGEAARRLGVSVDTMRRWDREGRLRAKRLHGQRVYTAADLESVIDNSGDAA